MQSTMNYIETLREKHEKMFQKLSLELGMDSYLLSYFGKVKIRIDAFEDILQDPLPGDEFTREMYLYIKNHPYEESSAIEKEINEIKTSYLKLKPNIPNGN